MNDQQPKLKKKTFGEFLMDDFNSNIKKLRYKITLARTMKLPEPFVQNAENTIMRVIAQCQNLNRELENAQRKIQQQMNKFEEDK